MTRPVTAQLIFVTATRLSQAQFESGSPLAQSLRRVGQLTPLALRLFADNRAALGSCYNQAIDEAPRGACLVFVHDDVFIDDWMAGARIVEALQRFDVVGVRLLAVRSMRSSRRIASSIFTLTRRPPRFASGGGFSSLTAGCCWSAPICRLPQRWWPRIGCLMGPTPGFAPTTSSSVTRDWSRRGGPRATPGRNATRSEAEMRALAREHFPIG